MSGFSLIADVKTALRIVEDIRKYIKVSARASVSAVKIKTDKLKNNLRSDIRSAGLGTRLGNTWRGKVYPEGGKTSMDAAGFLWSKAPHIIDAYDKGATITARNARYLAVPLPGAQKMIGFEGKRRRLSPEIFEKKFGYNLVKIDRPGQNPILIARGVRQTKRGNLSRLTTRGATKRMGPRTDISNRVDIPLFVLVPMVKVRKRIDVARRAGEAVRRLSDTLYSEKQRLLK